MNKLFNPPLLLISVVLLTSCNGVNNRDEDKLLTPVLNPNPKHVVKIFGRIPASLDVQLGAGYSPESKAEGCEMPPPSPGRLLPTAAEIAALDKYSRGGPLKVMRKGEYFEATFVVDKYLPGFCQWDFDGVGVSVIKDKNPDLKLYYEITPIVDGVSYRDPPNLEECEFAPKDRRCILSSNSEPTPVYVRCKLLPADPNKLGDKPELSCESREPASFKREHLLMPDTREVEVRFYDINVGPDPMKDVIEAQKQRDRDKRVLPPYPYSDVQ